MEEMYRSAGKEALVGIVRMTQKQRLGGVKGQWKPFLRKHDKKSNVGECICDPAKRSLEDLITFLNTFEDEDTQKVFEKILVAQANRKTVEKLEKNSEELESPQQRLVRLTYEHPEYPLNYSLPSHREDWLVIKLGNLAKAKKSNDMIAVDCEMVLCEDGTEGLVKVCVVDHNLEVMLNELVNPGKAIADYRADITGITAKDLEGVTTSLEDVQKSMKKLLRHGTILVGHSLNHDLKALKVDHARVVDTSLIFTNVDGPSRKRPSLNDLCKFVLGHYVRGNNSPHDCLEDARTAMKLALAKIKMEQASKTVLESKSSAKAVSEPEPSNQVVSESNTAKLLLHDIPVGVPKNELRKIFNTDITYEIENIREHYTAVAIFKNPEEANKAFESIPTSVDKDSKGRPQKLASVELNTGLPANVYVCKWGGGKRDIPGKSRKRSRQDEESSEVHEEPKKDLQRNGHAGEIERLKKELCQKDNEVSSLQKIVAALTRKQGL